MKLHVEYALKANFLETYNNQSLFVQILFNEKPRELEKLRTQHWPGIKQP